MIFSTVLCQPNASFCCERSHHRARSELPRPARQQQAQLGPTMSRVRTLPRAAFWCWSSRAQPADAYFVSAASTLIVTASGLIAARVHVLIVKRRVLVMPSPGLSD